jgi:hypothetical protein
VVRSTTSQSRAVADGKAARPTKRHFCQRRIRLGIAIKRAIGKLAFAAPIAETIERLGFDLIPITAAHAEHAGGLPRHHSDPFDRCSSHRLRWRAWCLARKTR